MKKKGRVYKYIWAAAIFAALLLNGPAYGAVEIYDMDDELSDSPWIEDEGEMGPWDQPEDFGNPAGTPAMVKEVRIKEMFVSETGTYKDNIEGKYVFTTNVSNGGVAEEYVYFELPSEITFSLSKEGVEIPYENGEKLYEPGSYVMNFLIAGQTEGSRQVDYRTTFRFKIREEEPAAEESQWEPSGIPDSKPGRFGMTESEMAEFGLTESDLAELGVAEWEPGQRETADSGTDSGTEDYKTEDYKTEETPENTYNLDLEEQTFDWTPGGGLYTKIANNFTYKFDNNLKISSNIPDGTITTKVVSLEIEGDAPFSVYKDDELMEWEDNTMLQEAGDYTVVTGKQSFSFRISQFFTRSRWFYSPDGFQIKSVNFNNNKININRRDRFELKQDGKYQVELINGEGMVMECIFEKDSISPEYTVSHVKASAVVDFQSTDIEKIVVYKDGELIKPTYNNVYSEAGDYRITVYDLAGNFTEKDFKVAFRLNAFSIVLILLTAGLALALVTTVFITKNKIKIR